MKFREYLNEKLKDPEFKKLYERFKDKIVEEALAAANLKLGDIGLISFSQGPGLPPCLIVGMKKAKELAKKAGVTQQQLSKIEHGYNSNIMTYIKVAEALGLSVGVYK